MSARRFSEIVRSEAQEARTELIGLLGQLGQADQIRMILNGLRKGVDSRPYRVLYAWISEHVAVDADLLAEVLSWRFESDALAPVLTERLFGNFLEKHFPGEPAAALIASLVEATEWPETLGEMASEAERALEDRRLREQWQQFWKPVEQFYEIADEEGFTVCDFEEDFPGDPSPKEVSTRIQDYLLGWWQLCDLSDEDTVRALGQLDDLGKEVVRALGIVEGLQEPTEDW